MTSVNVTKISAALAKAVCKAVGVFKGEVANAVMNLCLNLQDGQRSSQIPQECLLTFQHLRLRIKVPSGRLVKARDYKRPTDTGD